MISIPLNKFQLVKTTNIVHENDLLFVLDLVQTPRNTSLPVPDECTTSWGSRPGVPGADVWESPVIPSQTTWSSRTWSCGCSTTIPSRGSPPTTPCSTTFSNGLVKKQLRQGQGQRRGSQDQGLELKLWQLASRPRQAHSPQVGHGVWCLKCPSESKEIVLRQRKRKSAVRDFRPVFLSPPPPCVQNCPHTQTSCRNEMSHARAWLPTTVWSESNEYYTLLVLQTGFVLRIITMGSQICNYSSITFYYIFQDGEASFSTRQQCVASS